MPEATTVLAALEQDGLLRREPERYRTTRKWQAALVRAAAHLYMAGDLGDDLRVPIAMALVEIYGDDLEDGELAMRTEALLPIEEAELHPAAPG